MREFAALIVIALAAVGLLFLVTALVGGVGC